MIILAVVISLLMIVDTRFGWLLAAFAVVYVYLLVMGSVKICSGFYTEVICHGGTQEKKVALTFDDGPDETFTPRILEILAKHQVKATFFVIGSRAENQESILRQVVSAGHTIGNHSYSHAFLFDLFGKKKMEQDLQKADEVIMQVTGEKPALFRPPYGVTTPVVAKVIKKMGYRAVGWSVRSLDTVLKDKEKILERIKDRLHHGVVILMHDDREITAEVLEDVIMKIKEEGYRFVGIEEMMLHKVSLRRHEGPQRR
jgi:peptidoglycan/xylan/chitin deacetylase (PgdA/CDA1 family)